MTTKQAKNPSQAIQAERMRRFAREKKISRERKKVEEAGGSEIQGGVPGEAG